VWFKVIKKKFKNTHTHI